METPEVEQSETPEEESKPWGKWWHGAEVGAGVGAFVGAAGGLLVVWVPLIIMAISSLESENEPYWMLMLPVLCGIITPITALAGFVGCSIGAIIGYFVFRQIIRVLYSPPG